MQNNNETNNNTFAQNIENLGKIQEEAQKSEKDQETGEDSDQFLIFNQIVECIKEMLEMDAVDDVFKLLTDKLGKESADAIVSLISVIVPFACQNAITFYNNIISSAINEQTTALNNNHLMMRSQVDAYEAVLQVQKKKIGDLEKEIEIIKMKL